MWIMKELKKKCACMALKEKSIDMVTQYPMVPEYGIIGYF